MGKDLRGQFKPTPIKKLKKQVDEENSMIGATNNEYLSLEDGKSIKIRIFPPHPGLEEFYVPKKSYWLSVAKKDGDLGRTTVLDSKVHGGTKMDIVDEYVKMAKKIWAKDSDKLNAISGDKDSLNPSYTWMAYASKVVTDEELHPMLWEFKKMVRDALNKLSFSEDEGEAIETDPFTDLDEGLPVLVKYMKSPNKKKGENYYEVSFPKKATAVPISDEVLESFISLKPLNEVLPKYGIRDFDRALEGLQNFDDSNELGLFDNEDWIEKVEEVKSQYDAAEEEEDSKPAKKKTVTRSSEKPAKKAVKEAEEEEEEPAPKKKKKASDEFDDMDRDELKEYIAENDLDVKVKKSFEDDDIRSLIREALANSAKEAEEEAEEESEETGDEFDSMSREELKEYIAENDLDVKVKKSFEDDDIRGLIREALAASGEETEEEEEEAEEAPKAKLSLADIQKKLAAGKK